ncbi:squalene cyclase [Cellulomonas sp. NPDC089187]|uniref:squalene cyclase n=1 Tax=Cellulomonas sp. NPDC089187 TaxID=3154970 RepID=UPI003421668B
MTLDAELVDWLLDTDPALRWQVQRDLLQEPADVWQATRALVPTEGFGARLLSLQDPDGQWAGGAFFPRGFDGMGEGQPWTATTWSLNSLREWGVDAAMLGDTGARLATVRWEYDDLPYWGGEVDVCINSWTLMNGLWLGIDVDPLVDWFLQHQQSDGGWNCEWVEGSTRSSFHSTLNALRGLLDHAQRTGDLDRTAEARHRGEEYLLARRLHRRLSTGDSVGPWTTRLRYPWRWAYSVLGAAEYFRAAAGLEGTAPDSRLGEAMDLIRDARGADGRWEQGPRLAGEAWFEVDVPEGEPSPWVTWAAIRVLDWWDSALLPSHP